MRQYNYLHLILGLISFQWFMFPFQIKYLLNALACNLILDVWRGGYIQRSFIVSCLVRITSHYPFTVYFCLQGLRDPRGTVVCVGLGGVYCTYPVPLHAHTHFLSSVRAAFVLHRVRGQALTAPLLLSYFRVSQHIRHTLLMCRVQTLQKKRQDSTLKINK